MGKVKHIGATFLVLGAIAALVLLRNQINWAVTGAAIALLVLVVILFRRFSVVKSMRSIDAMGGHEFEGYLAKLFKGLGYSVKTVGVGGGDFGADLVIEKRGVKIAVQAKNYHRKNHVGNDSVQQAIAGATYYDCHEAMVVTNSTFTKAAREQAEGCSLFPVTLWGREDLEKAIGKL